MPGRPPNWRPIPRRRVFPAPPWAWRSPIKKAHTRNNDRPDFARRATGGEEANHGGAGAQHDHGRPQRRCPPSSPTFLPMSCSRLRSIIRRVRNGITTTPAWRSSHPSFEPPPAKASTNISMRVFSADRHPRHRLELGARRRTAAPLLGPAHYGPSGGAVWTACSAPGRWQQQQIVPADWLKTATAPSQSLEKSYGFLWWNNTQGRWPGVPADAFAAIGLFENDLLIIPSLDLIVVRQVGDEGGPPAPGQDRRHSFRLAVEAVADAPAAVEMTPPRSSRPD